MLYSRLGLPIRPKINFDFCIAFFRIYAIVYLFRLWRRFSKPEVVCVTGLPARTARPFVPSFFFRPLSRRSPVSLPPALALPLPRSLSSRSQRRRRSGVSTGISAVVSLYADRPLFEEPMKTGRTVLSAVSLLCGTAGFAGCGGGTGPSPCRSGCCHSGEQPICAACAAPPQPEQALLSRAGPGSPVPERERARAQAQTEDRR